MDAQGVTNRDISRRILLGEGSVSSILSGRHSPSLANFMGIISVLGLQPSYVLLGEGAKYVGEEAPRARSSSSTELKPVGSTAGVDAWLIETDLMMTRAEKAYMRRVEWLDPECRLPDKIYEAQLGVYRMQAEHVAGNAA
jgi:transcriptional regulator with XRE-family HTH domain